MVFAIAFCILYPNTTVVVVAPTKAQSTRFIKKIYELKKNRPNLECEIKKDGIKTGVNESSIEFVNGSKIVTVPYSENALGIFMPRYIEIYICNLAKTVKTEMLIPC